MAAEGDYWFDQYFYEVENGTETDLFEDENATDYNYDNKHVMVLMHHRNRLSYVLAHIYPFLIITGFILNLITAIGLGRRRMQKEHHTTIYLITILLTSAYLMASHFSMYTFYKFGNSRIRLTKWSCKIWSFADQVVWSSISWLYSLLLVDRFLQHAFSCWPDSACWSKAARNFCTRKTAFIAVATILSTFFLLHIYILIYYESPSRRYSFCGSFGRGKTKLQQQMLEYLYWAIEILKQLSPFLTIIFIIVVIVFFRLSKRRFAFSLTPFHLSNSEAEIIEKRYTLIDLIISSLDLFFRLISFVFDDLILVSDLASYFLSDIFVFLLCLVLVINPVFIIVLLPSLRDELYRVFVDLPRRVCGNCVTETRNSIRRRFGHQTASSVSFSTNQETENVNIRVENAVT